MNVEMAGGEPTCTVVTPADSAETGTTVVDPPAGIVAVAGTAATLGLSDVTVKVIAVGMAEGRLSIRFSTEP